MDTRFWGPDGWNLLHSIAYNYPKNPTIKLQSTVKKFFKTLPYVLPCVYCRNSLSKYFKELPIDDKLKNNTDLFKWLYTIHNKVNRKLTLQNLNKKPDPTISKVKRDYKKFTLYNNKDTCIRAPGITFLYSIAFNYPITKTDFKTAVRYKNHKLFLKLLGELYPFNQFKKKYQAFLKRSDLDKVLDRRCHFKRWVYKLDNILHTNCPSYKEKCKDIEIYRAKCKITTCRKAPNKYILNKSR
tara:strand:- start:94 stop:816 length:723 start_codon:yes stop_codon:yes gene_type:complete